MTFQQLGSRALFAGAFLTGLLLAAPVQAEPPTKADSQGLEQAVSRVRQAIGEAEGNGNITPPVEHAVNELLLALGDEEGERRRHHHDHHHAGSFGAGFEQAGDLMTTSTSSTGNSGTAGDSSTDSADSGASPSQTGSLSTTNGPISIPSNALSNSSNPQNSQTQGQERHHGRHRPFADGLRHAEREWREKRMERRLEHAFARGLAALHAGEEHLAARSNSQTSSKTARSTPSARPGQSVGANPNTAPRHQGTSAAGGQKSGNATTGTKGSSTAAHGRTGVLVGQHSAAAHPSGGFAGHAPSGHHAGALVGMKHFGHKK